MNRTGHLSPRARALVGAFCLLATGVSPASVLVSNDFEDGLGNWQVFADDFVALRDEPGTGNSVLELRPQPGSFSYVILEDGREFGNVRMEGRFLFPTEGHGYLGFIYNFAEDAQRKDFGCIYVKSNGSYVRISPHYDGNPSWRLYEELKVPLTGEQHIEVGRWYRFRLDVAGNSATLYIDDMQRPVTSFALFERASGALGLEARPGRGEPVWVDDVVVTTLADTRATEAAATVAPPRLLANWQAYGPVEMPDQWTPEHPDLPADGWARFAADPRGALITGRLTQFSSGDADTLYLRTSFDAGDEPRAGWLAFSSANRLDVWLNGFYRGSVADDRYAWGDFLTNPAHTGALLPMLPSPGRNEVVVRVHGRRFAGGGFYADLAYPEAE